MKFETVNYMTLKFDKYPNGHLSDIYKNSRKPYSSNGCDITIQKFIFWINF